MKVIINFFINYKLFIVYKETNSHTGTRTRVAWVKTKYPNHLDYMGLLALYEIRTHDLQFTRLTH